MGRKVARRQAAESIKKQIEVLQKRLGQMWNEDPENESHSGFSPQWRVRCRNCTALVSTKVLRCGWYSGLGVDIYPINQCPCCGKYSPENKLTNNFEWN
jgi:hypothetical protein